MDVLLKVGLPRSMPYFFASLKVAITLAFVGAMAMAMYERFAVVEKRTTAWAHRGGGA
jgi:NitT/TauT family transport system permease protein